MANLPLNGLSVLDLTAHWAGPTAVRQLADWGADVIKIEPPGEAKGDVLGGNRHGFDFQNLHRNKRGMTLNLKAPEAHAIFMKLAAKADVVVENYRSDVKYRLKVDYDTIAAVNPRIVYGSISGFGQSGPDATRPGVDQIAQGMGGLMSVTGLPGQGPVRVGIPIADLTAGIFLSQAILLALMQRAQTGKGQWVHTSLLPIRPALAHSRHVRWPTTPRRKYNCLEGHRRAPHPLKASRPAPKSRCCLNQQKGAPIDGRSDLFAVRHKRV